LIRKCRQPGFSLDELRTMLGSDTSCQPRNQT
jgi:hypothetical protein